MSLPQSAAEITPQWLSHALGVPVSAVALDAADNGTTGRAQLSVSCAEPDNLPSRLFVKLPPADPQQRAFVCSTGMGKREARFYAELAGEVPVRVPRCFYAGFEKSGDESGEQFIMLLEQLEDSGCSFRNASTRYSHDYLREVLSAFARLHGQYWQSPRFDDELSWVGPIVQHSIARQLLPVALSAHGADMPPVFTELCELYLTHEDAIQQIWREGETTLIHGDVHDGNLFYDRRAGAPGFLDWALLAEGPAMRDVGYFLAGTLTPDAQREYSPALLAFYRSRLQEEGVRVPVAADLERQYAIQAVYPWLGAAVTLAMGNAWQPSRYVLATLDRLHRNINTLNSLPLLRECLS